MHLLTVFQDRAKTQLSVIQKVSVRRASILIKSSSLVCLISRLDAGAANTEKASERNRKGMKVGNLIVFGDLNEWQNGVAS